MSGPTTCALPVGTRVRLTSTVTRCHGGDVLFCTRSGAMVRLRSKARDLLAGRDEILVSDKVSATLARALLDRGLADPMWDDDALTESLDVTVVIPVRDRRTALVRLLAALPAVGAVIVVDDGSTDADALRTIAQEWDAQLVRHDVSQGPSAARNSGLRQAVTPYVAFLDSDVVPDAGCLAALARELRDPAVALVAPRVLALPVDRPGWVARYEDVHSSLDLGKTPGRVAPGTRLSYVPSAALLARRDALGDGFDADMRVAEDVDLVWRLHRAGWVVRYQPAAMVRHEHRIRLGEWVTRKAFYGTGAAPLALRHGDRVAPLRLAPLPTAAVLGAATLTRPGAALAATAVAAQLAVTSRRLRQAGAPSATWALTGMSLAATGAQLGASLNRHHWPLAVAGAACSRRVRWWWAIAAVTDAVTDHRRTHSTLDLPRHLLARRLDDLAYGAGVWWGAARSHTLGPLLPAGLRRQHTQKGDP
ncbi:mycofactocin system glycosyltransferase [Yimella lutea]|uniref:Mycofactocin system glycosyltransferase n=1 Tax=Yimella lutea TaxID=587872 RepID=A0A542EJZ5_9MICO|nr:mycofactocin biosynthesis glycosyltransferase MftF [Yimella lutea]TQJ15648.1 mycofactocin system glycosyltransferase [Yimella lutea]